MPDGLGQRTAFRLVVTRDEVVRPKPHPDVYRAVCDSLEIIAEECLAIEDSPDGVRAALSAGIETLAVATPMTRNALAAARLLPRWCIVRAPEDLLRTVQWCLARRVRPSADPGVARSVTSHK